jgi:hypothetical protein
MKIKKAIQRESQWIRRRSAKYGGKNVYGYKPGTIEADSCTRNTAE